MFRELHVLKVRRFCQILYRHIGPSLNIFERKFMTFRENPDVAYERTLYFCEQTTILNSATLRNPARCKASKVLGTVKRGRHGELPLGITR